MLLRVTGAHFSTKSKRRQHKEFSIYSSALTLCKQKGGKWVEDFLKSMAVNLHKIRCVGPFTFSLKYLVFYR